MKGMKWVGVVALLGVIGVAVWSALDGGEKSPFFVEGTVDLAPELGTDVVGITTMFITIFDEESQMPMPYGAMKETLSADFKPGAEFKVTKETLMVMNPDAPTPKRLRVKVRLDKDGVAGPDQPGDLVGIQEHVAFGDKVTIKIDKKVGL